MGTEPVKRPTVTTEVQVDDTTSLNQPFTGSGTQPGARQQNADASAVEFGANGKPVEKAPLADTGDAPADDATGDAPAEGDAPAADDAAPPAEGTPTEPLAPWDEANPEVAAAYEARYFKEGKLDLSAVTKEFWGNAKKGVVGELHEDTYKFLEATIGITKDAAKAIEKGLVAEQKAAEQAFLNRVGGAKRYNAAIEWGKTNYTPAQRARFNALRDGGDVDAFNDAVDALMGRYARANPGQQQQQQNTGRRGPPRAASPQRSVTTNAEGLGGGGAAAPFKDKAAYSAAFTAAINAERAAKTPAERRAAIEAREKIQRDGRRSNLT